MSSAISVILTAVYDELGVTRPQAFVGNADGQVRQMLAHFQAMGDKLAQSFEWQGLIKQGTLVLTTSASYALPNDFSGFIDETQWDGFARARVSGPRNQRDWAQVEGAGVNIGPYFAQQIRNNLIYLQPTPTAGTAGHVLTYYYLSGYWLLDAGVSVARPLSDNDTTIWLDDRMQICGTKYRWLRSKGLDYLEERDEYEDRMKQLISQDRGAKTLSLDPSESQGYGQTGFVVPIPGFGQ